MRIIGKFLSLFGLWLAGVNALAQCHETLAHSFDSTSAILINDGTVFDQRTGLMWMRCSLGRKWQDGTCMEDHALAARFTWGDALVQSEKFEYANYNDWRLPNKNELESIVERRCYDPAVDTEVFPNTQVIGYWTNSANNFNEAFAWAINFANGDHVTTRRTNLLAVRLMREIENGE